MALPASGEITFAQICAEFGLNAATAVWPASFYGKGGAPSSGPLSFADFYGRAGVSVTINPATSYSEGATSVGNASHTVVVTGGVASSYNWAPVDGGTVVSGQGTATASLRGNDGIARVYRCDVVVNGVTYSPTCTRIHTQTG